MLVLVLVYAASVGQANAAPGGHLVIIGGGTRPTSVVKRFLELAGGPAAARLVVIGHASEDPAGAARGSVEAFKALGVERVQALPANPEEATSAIKDATGVYFTGGDQVKLVDALNGTRVTEALHHLWSRGGVIGGTSAGAAVMSACMITGEEHGIATEEERFRSIQAGQIETTNGFGFVTRAVIDQHFIARKRANRLFSVVLEHPKLIGIGIDESTAIVVGPDERFEVVGDRSVMVIDGREASARHTGADRRLAATNLRVHILVTGDRFDLKRGRPLPARTGAMP